MSETRTQQWAVVYDISVDKERSRVEKTLKGWGHRAQKSVFLVTTTRSGIRTLERELGKVKPQSGTVLILRLQSGVQPVSIGQPWEHPDADIAYIF